MFKRILTLLLAAVMMVSLVACNNSTDDETDGEEAQAGIPVSALSELAIIFPQSGIEKVLSDACADMRRAIEEKYSVELQYKDDFIKGGATPPDTYEILVGETNRSESTTVYSELEKYDDLEIRLVGKKLVIAGGNQELLAKEVEKLTEAIKGIADGALEAIDASMQVSIKGEYKVGQILLEGERLSKYTIVYQNNAVCRGIANEMSDSILKTTGYKLKVRDDGRAMPDGRKILLGNTKAGVPSGASKSKTEEYYIANQNGDIYLFASEIYAIHDASLYFAELINSATGEVVEIKPEIGAVVSKDTTITSMSFNLWTDNISDRKENVINTIKKHNPDTFGVQEANETWMGILKSELGDTYAYVGVGREPAKTSGGSTWGETSAVFYKKSEFTLVDSGTKWLTSTPDIPGKISGSEYYRIFTYALLKRNSDGVQFMHINTHLDSTSDLNIKKQQAEFLINFVNENSDKAIIISGDFNTKANEPAYAHITSVMDNSSEIAMDSDKTGTFWRGTTIDFIFMSKNDFTVFDYTVDNSITDRKLSDHYPVLVTFKVK